MNEITIGLVGLGRFAQQHLQCWQQIDGIKLQAVCDIRQDLAEQTAREMGCSAYTDVNDMLQHEKLDVLDILLPESYHYDAAMAGLAAGCHLFVEKPLETDVAKAAGIARMAAEKELLLMVGHVTRFDSRYIQMKQAIERGEIGRVRSIYAKRSDLKRFFPIFKRTPTIMVLGIHDIDQILWCAKELPVEVYAKSSSSEEGEDLVWAMLTFRDGLIAVIESNWLTPDAWPAAQDQSMSVNGDLGVLRMQSPDHAFSICTNELYELPSLFGLRDIHGRLEGPLMSELTHFIACIRSGEASTILPTADALNAVRVADAIVRSCREGHPIRLEAAEAG